jgi:proline iminopeptidase
MFGSLADVLSGHLHVIRWDQRGSGRSERRGPYSVARSAADLDAVRAHFGPAKTVLLGHSWGATLALRYALDHPDRVSALVYVSGVGLGWAWREPFQREVAARLAPHQSRIDELRASGEDREVAIVQWSAEFSEGREYAEQMATPWFAINHDCCRRAARCCAATTCCPAGGWASFAPAPAADTDYFKWLTLIVSFN